MAKSTKPASAIDICASIDVGSVKISQASFDSLLDSYLQTYQPKKKGRSKSSTQLAVIEHFDSIKRGIDRGVPFKELAILLSQATGLDYNESRIRSQWTAEARKRHIKPPVKHRKATK